jgi:site-specific recombinase XerD
MVSTKKDQWAITDFSQETHLLTWVEAFLMDRKSQGVAAGTLYFYQKKLALFTAFCESKLITEIIQITPNDLREYMQMLEDKGHNPGGRHACYRAVKTFLYWWADEVESEGWKNPIQKGKPPRLSIEPLDPVGMDTIKALLNTCKRSAFYDLRDKAIILALMDTGARASELIAMNLEDVEISGAVLIRKGKGGKPRSVFFGKKTRKALRAYLRKRTDENIALWVTNAGERLTYWGLRQIMRRRAERAGIEEPGLHSFRRFFALECLRSGKMSIYELQHLMGHADLQVLRRYLAITEQDTEQAHRRAGSVDNANL